MSLCAECGAKLPADDGFCVVCEFVGCDDVPPWEVGATPATPPTPVTKLTGNRADVEPVPGLDVAMLPSLAPESSRTDQSVAVRVRFDRATVAADESPTVHAMIEVEASGPPLRAMGGSVVAHVILALDLSASMDTPDKYPVLQRALTHMLDEMRFTSGGDVLVSIVLFAHGAEVLVRDRLASQLDPREVLGWLDAAPLRFTRYTDLAGALSRAGRIALDAHALDRRIPLRIYVLTDGRPQDIERARRIMSKIERVPVDVHGLAFGADADVRVLQSLVAGRRGGTVKHVRSDNLSASLGRIAEVAQHVVAKRCALEIQLAAGVTGGAVHRFRPGRFAFGDGAFDHERTFRTDLGTLESGRVYSLLVEIVLPPTVQNESMLGTVTARIPGDGGPRAAEHFLVVGRHRGPEEVTPDPIVVEALDIVSAGEGADPGATLRALRARHRLYVDERRDPQLISLVEKAVVEIEEQGSLDALSREERAALLAHTHSVS